MKLRHHESDKIHTIECPNDYTYSRLQFKSDLTKNWLHLSKSSVNERISRENYSDRLTNILLKYSIKIIQDESET